MKARPILFSGPMVRALLDGRKTQTRRVLLITGPCGDRNPVTSPDEEILTWDDGFHYASTGGLSGPWPCPYGVPGDLLWARESGELLRDAYDHDPATGKDLWRDVGWVHGADGKIVEKLRPFSVGKLADWIDDCARHGRPSIHMPRWANRLTLGLAEVRVERLHDISEADAIAEGVFPAAVYGGKVASWLPAEDHRERFYDTARDAYFALWAMINGQASVDANPWVWVLDFKGAVHPENVNRVLEAYEAAARRSA